LPKFLKSLFFVQTLTIKNLNTFDQARILYNHIWFSKLTEEYIDEYYKDKRYKEIINHTNFNPRLIEFITDIDRLTIYSSSDYWNYILNILNNPKDIWNDCFKIQTNAYVRNLVKLTVFNGGAISEYDLRNSYAMLNKIEKLQNTSHTEKDFRTISQLSTNSFLSRNKMPTEVTYSLFNPSIADYVLSEYCSDFETSENIFKSINTVKSLKNLLVFERDKIISQENINKLKNTLFTDAFQQNKSLDYLIFISYFNIDDDNKKDSILELLKNIINDPSPIEEFSILLDILMKYHEYLDMSDYDFLLCCINDRYLDESELGNFAVFLEFLDIDNTDIIDELTSNLEQYLIEELDSIKGDINMSDFVIFSGGYYLDYDDSDDDVNEGGITSGLFILTESLVEEFDSDLFRELDINFQEIVNTVDIDKMISDYISSQEESDYEGYRGNSYNFNQDIDDLFERP